MGKILRVLFAAVALVFLVTASLTSLTSPGQVSGSSNKSVQKKINKLDPNGAMTSSGVEVPKVTNDINSMPLTDNPDLYAYEDPGSVVTMYLTVRRGNDLENTNHTWKEVNSATHFFFENNVNTIAPKAEAILQIGDEKGPLPNELGYGAMVPNATISIRGNSTSMYPQKSFKITLFDSAGEWRAQQTINLLKSITDPTRVRNKLAYDLLENIPNMTTLRTQFVHLYIKDETADPPGQASEDYGLFTQIEMPNKKFLKNHLLDRYGQLYKAIMFEFYRYPDQLRETDDPSYNETEFEKVLEIKGNKDHTKLLEMLDAVNNYAIPIQETFEQYFDEDNYFTWMAFNILTENVDTNAQNFYLYSPQNGQKWYFLPWDYDGGFNRAEDKERDIHPFEHGISTYWNVVLHQRVLMVPEYRKKLDDKVQELLAYLTPQRLTDMLNVYKPVAYASVIKMPDIYYYPGTIDRFEEAFKLLPQEPQVNYKLYLESLKTPLPFYLDTPEYAADKLRFAWGEAYDLNAEDITYKFALATDWDFTNIVSEVTLTNLNHIEIPKLNPGTYFWKVTATNKSGYTAYPFDYYQDSESVYHYSMKYLYISPTGEILEKERE